MTFFKKLLKRKLFWFFVILAGAIGGYFIYKSATATPATTRYVTAAATKGSISVSVSGTGQVASINQVDVKPNVSGTIVSLPVTQGQAVAAGALIASLDSRTAQRAVSDAQTNLETAKLSLQKALAPTDSLTLLQQQNSLIDAQNNLEQTKDNLDKAYDDGFTTVSNAFLNLPGTITGLQDVLMGNGATSSQWNVDFYADSIKKFDDRASSYRDDAYNSYLTARDSYDKAFADYKLADRSSDHAKIVELINETYETSLEISTAVKNTNNLIQFYKDQMTVHSLRPIALADTQLSTLNGYAGTANTYVSSLLSAKRTIENDIQSIDDSNRSIAEKKATIEKANAGPDELDIRSLQISIQQKQNSLQDAQDKLSDYYVRAPFAGIVAKVNAKKGDTASSGSALITLISPQQVAEITLNEVDLAKIKVGQKATIAFDAIEDLSISGVVAQIDSIGTVSQGVVSYSAQISFDAQDSRVKPGMSVAAAIITDFKGDILTVPNTAVKTQGASKYVQVLTNGQPVRTTVTTGLANDTDTEIVSGLNEGDNVVTQTITSSSAKTTTTGTSSILGGGSVRIPGATSGGGGFAGPRN